MSDKVVEKVKPIDGRYRTENPNFRLCLFFPHGLDGPSMTAVVVSEDAAGRGILDLAVFAGGSRMEGRLSIRHCADTFFEYNPDAKQYGVWDYLDIDRPAVAKKVKSDA